MREQPPRTATEESSNPTRNLPMLACSHNTSSGVHPHSKGTDQSSSYRDGREELLFHAQELVEAVVILHDDRDLQRRGRSRGWRCRPPRRGGSESSLHPLPALSGTSEPSGRCGRRRELKRGGGGVQKRGGKTSRIIKCVELRPPENTGTRSAGNSDSETIRLQLHGSARLDGAYRFGPNGGLGCRTDKSVYEKSGTCFTPVLFRGKITLRGATLLPPASTRKHRRCHHCRRRRHRRRVRPPKSRRYLQ